MSCHPGGHRRGAANLSAAMLIAPKQQKPIFY